MNNPTANITITFTFQDNSVLTVKEKPFNVAVKTGCDYMTFENQPIKILFPNTKKVLYFDKEMIFAYLQNELSQIELIEKLQCDGLFRNKNKLLTNTKEEIDPGALWMKRGDELFLVSGDEFVLCDHVDSLFQEV